MPIPNLQFEDYRLQLFTQAVQTDIQVIQASPIVYGLILTDVALTTSFQDIYHKLNKVPKGYFVIRKNANADIWNASIDDKVIQLRSSAAVTVDLWVF